NISAETFCDTITKSQDLHKSVLTVLGVFEDTSLAIQSDMACEKILYFSLGFLVPWVFNNVKPYIDHRRSIDDDPTLYAEMEKLAKSWAEKKSLVSGEKLED